MKTRIKEIYNCEHCNKLYLNKKCCIKHEKYCMKNSNNTPKCFGCVFIKEHQEIRPNYKEEISYEPKHFYCTKLQKAVHPAKLQRKIDLNLLNEETLIFVNDSGTELMPKYCIDFEQEN